MSDGDAEGGRRAGKTDLTRVRGFFFTPFASISSIFFRFAAVERAEGRAGSVFIAEAGGRGPLRCLGGMGEEEEEVYSCIENRHCWYGRQ